MRSWNPEYRSTQTGVHPPFVIAAEAGIQTLYGFRPEACRNECPAIGDNGHSILWSGNKKAIDPALTHVCRMGLAAVEIDESENPVAIDVLRMVGIVVISENRWLDGSYSPCRDICAMTQVSETRHRLINTDARDLSFLPDESVHLVVTSPPYWNLKRYNEHPDQLGHIEDYESFLSELDKVWRHVFRILIPGGRLVCVVGDVCVSRKRFGRHLVFPLHSDISVLCRKIGFDNLNPIIWHKISNATFEVANGCKFLGKPYEPNAIIKNDIEFILMQRKPGGYRQPTEKQRELSKIKKKDFDNWFRQIWNITGASTKNHPAPFPLELASRLVRMFSFVGDIVLDPFCGTGTTLIAALRSARNSVGIEIDEHYCRATARYLKAETANLNIFYKAHLSFEKLSFDKSGRLHVSENQALYNVRSAKAPMI